MSNYNHSEKKNSFNIALNIPQSICRQSSGIDKKGWLSIAHTRAYYELNPAYTNENCNKHIHVNYKNGRCLTGQMRVMCA